MAELPSERSLFLVRIDLRIPVVIHGFEKHLTLRREIGLKGACLLTILFHGVNLLPLAKGVDKLSEIPRFPVRFPLN